MQDLAAELQAIYDSEINIGSASPNTVNSSVFADLVSATQILDFSGGVVDYPMRLVALMPERNNWGTVPPTPTSATDQLVLRSETRLKARVLNSRR